MGSAWMAVWRRYALRLIFSLSVSVCGFGIISGPLSAHAIIVETDPKPNAELAGQPFDFRLRFNSRIDPLRSRMVVIDEGGKETALTLKVVPDADRMEASVSGLAPGAYRLRWQVLAVDGHVTRGDIPFRISK